MVSHQTVRGVPTGHAAAVFAAEIGSDHAFVWPDPQGSVVGEAVQPLYEQGVELPERCPSVYDTLALVDSLRVDRARERKIAAEKLRERLGRKQVVHG